MNPDSPNRLHFGAYEVDLRTREIRKDGLKVKLNGQPFEILVILLSRPGELITRAELQQLLWPDDPFIDARHGLNAAVNKLRDALDDSADEPQYVQTIPRRGYRFIGELNTPDAASEFTAEDTCKASPGAPTESAATLKPVTIQPVPLDKSIDSRAKASISATQKLTAPPRRPPRWPIFAAVSAALVIGIFGGLMLNQGLQNTQSALLNQKRQAEGQQRQAPVQMADPLQHDAELAETHSSLRRHDLQNSILQHDGEHLRLASTVRTIIAGDSSNAGPQFSPDGKHIAFMSNRSGQWQIWMSNADGSNPRQISFTESAGTPRWSPDGRNIAFDAPFDGGTHIFVVDAVDMDREREPHPLTEGCVPSFSRDGKWVYFASEHSGDWQVWKVPTHGGQEVQITTKGGFAALQSSDGYIYYAKTRFWSPEIWRVPVNGGEEALVSPRLRPRTWASWAVTQNGIYFVEDFPHSNAELSLYDPKEERIRDLAALPSAPFWMGASNDGKKVVMNDSAERQISLLENLR